jgi:molybdenum ABC transporter molybdate-binding protein
MRSALSRLGQVHLAWLAFLGSVGLLAALIGLLILESFPSAPDKTDQTLVLHCAAGIKAPIEEAVRDYEKATGVKVSLQYGGSQTLLSGIEVSHRGDLYLPGDDSYLLLARDKGLVAEVLPLARMKPVLAVPKGNPKQLRSFDDLVRQKVRIAQANPAAAAVGKLAREALEKQGRWSDIAGLVAVEKGTVNDVANDIVLGAVDAGIVWDATVRQYPGLEMVALPELAEATARVSIGVLTCGNAPTSALHLARYLAARDRGLVRFKEKEFEPVEGDAWAEKPEVRLLAGAMLRPAVEETIAAFEEREGVQVTRVFNGCGILVAQMRATQGGGVPDAFFACDLSFMEQVNDLFLDAVNVSQNQLVILVDKGNPHNIQTLRDLAKPGLRVGVGHEKQCALGVLTQETLLQGKVQGQVMKNVKVQTPTGDMLVNQMRTGSLDAVVVYISNAAEARGALDAIPVENIPCAVATQPFAISKESTHKHLMGRLLDAIRARQSRERFEALGFKWPTASAGK